MTMPPNGKPFGCPYHGVVYGGEVTLPNGQKKAYPQPASDGYHEPMAGRSFPIRPQWSPGGVQTQEDIDAGREWRDYAIIAGQNSQIHGQELGENCWIWAEAEGKVWKVEPLDSLDARDEPKDVTFRLTRFGWFGDPPDGELERTVTITIPQNAPEPVGDYFRFQGLTNETYGTDEIESVLAEANPIDGHAAIFVSAMRRSSSEKYGYPICCAFEVDLSTESANVLAMHNPAEGKVREFEDTPDNWKSNRAQYDSSEVVATYDCNGGTIEERRAVFVEGASSCAINYKNTHRYETANFILAAGYGQGGSPGVIWLEWLAEYHRVYTDSLTMGGEDTVYVSQTTGVSPADCGYVNDYGNAWWKRSLEVRTDYPVTWKLVSTNAGVLHQEALSPYDLTVYESEGTFDNSTGSSGPFMSPCGCGDDCITQERDDPTDFSLYQYRSGSYYNAPIMGRILWNYSVPFGEPGYAAFQMFRNSAPNVLMLGKAGEDGNELAPHSIDKIITGGGLVIPVPVGTPEHTPSDGVPTISVDHVDGECSVSDYVLDPIARV